MTYPSHSHHVFSVPLVIVNLSLPLYSHPSMTMMFVTPRLLILLLNQVSFQSLIVQESILPLLCPSPYWWRGYSYILLTTLSQPIAAVNTKTRLGLFPRNPVMGAAANKERRRLLRINNERAGRETDQSGGLLHLPRRHRFSGRIIFA